MASLGDEILDRIDRSQRRVDIRIGTLAAVDLADGSVTVTLAVGSVTGVRWVGSYSPTVGDVVVVSRVGSVWVVLGKMSKQLGAPALRYESTYIWPSDAWEWDGSAWSAPYEVITTGYLLYYTPLPVPSGATVTSARLTLTRGHSVLDAGAPLVSPTIYGTTQAPTSTPVGPPSLTPGYGPWRPGTLGYEEQASWALPSTFLTGLLSGAITGLAFSPAPGDEMTIRAGLFDVGASGLITVNYTLPA